MTPSAVGEGENRVRVCVPCVCCYGNQGSGTTHLCSRGAWPVQASADIRTSASSATVASCSRDQAKSHSAAPPAATAAQYTAERRFWWILGRGGGGSGRGAAEAAAGRTHRLCWGSSIHWWNHVLVRFWHSPSPARQARRMAFSWLYLPGTPPQSSRLQAHRVARGRHQRRVTGSTGAPVPAAPYSLVGEPPGNSRPARRHVLEVQEERSDQLLQVVLRRDPGVSQAGERGDWGPGASPTCMGASTSVRSSIRK